MTALLAISLSPAAVLVAHLARLGLGWVGDVSEGL